jgi:tetratricopeptide (TPR) repeat protein
VPTPPSVLQAESAPAQPSAPHKSRGRVRSFAPAAALVALALGVTGTAYVVRADPTPVTTPAYDEFADPDAPQVTTPPLAAESEPGIPLADGATASTIARLEAATTTTSSPSELALLSRLLLQQAAVTGDAETYNRAVAVLDRAVAQAPGDLAVRAQRAAARSTVHDFTGALKDAEAVLAVTPDDPGALGAAYDAAFETGRYGKAEKDLTALIALRPDAPQVLIRQARWVALHGDPAAAATLVGRARTAADNDGVVGTARASYELIAGKLALDEGRYDLAEGAYRNALAQAPGWHAALAGLGRTLAATGALTGAEAALAQAGDTVPLPDTLSALGDVRTLLGDADGAAAAYGTVDVVATLESSAQLFNRAVILSRADRGVHTAAAVRDAQAELTTRKDVYGYDALGWALLAHGQPEQAARAADRSLVLGTRDPRLLAHAGLAHAAAGHPVRAERLLSEAVSLSPEVEPVLMNRVRVTLMSLPIGAGA